MGITFIALLVFMPTVTLLKPQLEAATMPEPDRDFDLTWFTVAKEVAGRKAVQFEHLVGELTS